MFLINANKDHKGTLSTYRIALYLLLRAECNKAFSVLLIILSVGNLIFSDFAWIQRKTVSIINFEIWFSAGDDVI